MTAIFPIDGLSPWAVPPLPAPWPARRRPCGQLRSFYRLSRRPDRASTRRAPGKAARQRQKPSCPSLGTTPMRVVAVVGAVVAVAVVDESPSAAVGPAVVVVVGIGRGC